MSKKTKNKKLLVVLFVPLTTSFIIVILAFFKIYALIPILLALLLLSILRNGIFSFFIALFISCILFSTVDHFFELILKQIGFAVLAILTVGGVLEVLLSGEGGSEFYIWLRKKSKSFRVKKLLASLVALFNFFNSTTSVTASTLLLSEDFKSENISEEDKKDLLKIVLLLCNVACVLVPLSLWWLFYSKFAEDVPFSFITVIPFLFYPLIVISHVMLNVVTKEGNSEFILEKRKFDAKKLFIFLILPFLFIYIFMFAEGTHIWLYETGILGAKPIFSDKTLIFGSFFIGTILTFAIYIFSAALSTKMRTNLATALELAEKSRKIVESALNELENGLKEYIVEKRRMSAGTLRRLVSRLYVDAYTKSYLESAEYFRSIEPSGRFVRSQTTFTQAMHNIFDMVSRFVNLFLTGMKNILGAVLIFVGALGIKDLILELGVEIPGISYMHSLQSILPVLAFLFAVLIGYLIGTAWGTFAICFTLFIIPTKGLISPLTLTITLSAIISASVFINQISSVADNVILTESLTGFNSQYITNAIKSDAWACFFISAVLYMIFGVFTSFSSLSSPALIPITLLAIIISTFLAGRFRWKLSKRKKSLS